MSPAAVPSRIGPYIVHEPLGHGGMGEVFRAYDPRLEREVALKRVQPDRTSQRALRRFQREAKAVAKLNHASIVKLYDRLEAEGHHWIVMELVEGGSLRGVLANGPLPPRHVARIGLEIAAGLAVAHDAGIIHRDIKPDNVMLTVHGEVKILDFGLAKQIAHSQDDLPSSITTPQAVLGTVSAMSPEQALGHPVDGRSDLFSLGSLLFEALRGEHPFRGQSAADTLVRICTEPLTWPDEEASEGLRPIVTQLLQKPPELRPRNAREVVSALEVFAGPRSELATMVSRTSPQEGISVSTEGLSDAEDSAISDSDSEAFRNQSSLPTSPRTTHRSWAKIGLGLGLAGLIGAGLLALSHDVSPTDPAAKFAHLSPRTLQRQGMALLQHPDRHQDHTQAIAMFEYALSRNDRSAPAYAGLARAYWLRKFGTNDQQGDPSWLKRASHAAEQAVRLDPFLSVARMSRGLVYCASGRLDEAAQDFQEILRLHPDHAEAQFGMGCVYEAKNQFEDAVRAYRASITAEPDRPIPRHSLGQLLTRMGRYAEAEPIVRQTVERWPDSFMGYRNLGVIRYFRGDIGEAAELTQKALEIRPTGSLYSNLGTFYFMQGHYQRAAEAFERTLDMSHMAQRYLIWANLADAYRWIPGKKDKAQKAYGRAIALLRREQETKPDNLTLKTRLAIYLAKSGKISDALKVLTTTQIPPNDANALYRAAVTFELCERRQTALDTLKRAFKAGYSQTDVESDPELGRLRDDRRYHELLIEASP